MKPARRNPHLVRYLLIGFFTVAPLWVTWLVFDFLFGLLASAGQPLLRATARLIRPFSDSAAGWLLDTGVQTGLAALVTLVLLYGIGVLASLVVGKKVIALVEQVMERVPGVQTVYRATRKFLETVRQPTPGGQRVVLIPFPSPEMKALGLLTRVLKDADDDSELAVVYVPTSPNPTSGYVEIVPMADVVMTDWTVEEAMNFVMTGGANSPDTVRFRTPRERAG